MVGSWIVQALLSTAPAQAPAAGTVETFEYHVVEGDSCAAIARRFFGDRTRYDIIHQYNPGMGPTPHHLEPGRILILPRVATAPNTGPDAEVTAVRRSVEARAANSEGWSAATIGLDLFEGWRVNTLTRAAAELTFRDTSVLQMRENTLVIIFGATHAKARVTTTSATLDRGALRSRLGELAGGGKLQLETPSAEADIAGGLALVTVDGGGATRLANHGGAQAGVRSKAVRRKRVKVAERMGSKVEPGKAPSKPQPLPPTPAWDAGAPQRFVDVPGRGATITGRWAPIADAVRYRVEVARKPDGRDVIADVEVPASVTSFEIHGLPAGEYFVSLASIDADAFESPPSALVPVRITAARLRLPDGTSPTTPTNTDDSVPPPLPVPAGTIVTAPEGQRCAQGDDTPGEQVVLSAGDRPLRCTDASGLISAPLPIAIAAWSVAPELHGGPGLALVEGRPGEIVASIAAGPFAPPDVRVIAPAGIHDARASRTADGRWTITATAEREAPRAGTLQLVTGSDAIVLGEIAFTVGAPAPVEAAPPPERVPWLERHPPVRNLWELGIWGGIVMPSRALELFAPDRDLPEQGFRNLRRVAPDLGVRAGFYPLRVLGVELEAGVMPTRADNDARATLFAVRGHVVGQLGFSNVTPFVLAGAGAFGVGSSRRAVGTDVDASLHVGGGFKVFVHDLVVLRLEARDIVTASRGIATGATSTFELLAGASITLGRRRPARSSVALR